MKIKFTVPGKPAAKQRPRLNRKNGVFTPKTTRIYENSVKTCFMSSEGGKRLKSFISASIFAFFPIPESYSKKKKNQIRAGRVYPDKKPDADNIAKIILDSLNGLAYDDDKQIVDLRVFKRYSDNAKVVVELEEINPEELKKNEVSRMQEL